MTAIEAREWLRKLYRLQGAQTRIAHAERELGVSLLEVMHDDDLVVIFAEETKKPCHPW